MAPAVTPACRDRLGIAFSLDATLQHGFSKPTAIFRNPGLGGSAADGQFTVVAIEPGASCRPSDSDTFTPQSSTELWKKPCCGVSYCRVGSAGAIGFVWSVILQYRSGPVKPFLNS